MNPQLSLESLPDELVRMVFQLGSDSYGTSCSDQNFPIHISHVNRRFRCIALQTPCIWSRLDNFLPRHQLETYIHRSASAKLSIFVNLFESQYRSPSILSDFLKITALHCHRWVSFQYNGDDITVNEEGEALDPNILDYFDLSHLTVPCFTSLAWYSFISTWDMPYLSHFDGRNVLLDAQSVGIGLVSCKLAFHYDYEVSWNLDETLQVLEMSPRLQSLYFEFSGIANDCNTYPMKSGATCLRHLTTLQLNLIEDVDPGFIGHFVEAFELPALTDISVTFGTIRPPDRLKPGDLLEKIIPPLTQWTTLQNFTLDAIESSFPPDLNIVAKLSSELSSLQHVILKGRGICNHHFTSTLSPPSWKSLTLVHCGRKSCKKIGDWVESIARGQSWDGFDLNIVDAQNLNANLPKLKDIFGEKPCSS
ncbi:hypothetical protein BD410DRAFT_780711 [Rickenella mellea]|uniref:F-box domain-containing protein n=1 Tax=Rickenella mellea TaxID=50990 RepID=A0A4R5XG68_9AGAM|nr:hypothetical protein BD410DRAFT_780711 [Rickenella mellea]